MHLIHAMVHLTLFLIPSNNHKFRPERGGERGRGWDDMRLGQQPFAKAQSKGERREGRDWV